jgi:hypothetical protein
MQTRVSLCVGPQRAESSPSAAQPASIALTLDHPPASLSKLSYYEDVWPELTEPHKYHPPPIALHPCFIHN